MTCAKLCTGCGNHKPLDAFGPNKKAKDGLNWNCRLCANEKLSERLRKRGREEFCAQCSGIFVSIPRPGRPNGESRFCSPHCAQQKRSDGAAWKARNKSCKACNVEKSLADFRPGKLKCKACDAVQQSERSVAKGEDRACDHCGSIFLAKRTSNGLGRFCSRACVDESKVLREDRPCRHCGSIVRRPSTSESAFCNPKCHGLFANGPNSPHWKGGLRPNGMRAVYVGKRDGYSSSSWAEHRVIASHVIGRQLARSEVVIHIDGNNGNNAPSNLFVCESQSEWRRRVIGSTLPWPKESNLSILRNSWQTAA